ncbi:hypothetical protein [Pseudomonas typographi]|nr:hypothetical protein [Pseudomonas typographi]
MPDLRQRVLLSIDEHARVDETWFVDWKARKATSRRVIANRCTAA